MTDADLLPRSSTLRLLTKGDREPPLFLIHGLSGDLGEFDKIAAQFRSRHALWGIGARGLDGAIAPETCVEEMAARYVESVRTRQPVGPYVLAGYSFGGLVAVEMARQLAARGDSVARLILIHAVLDEQYWPTGVWIRVMARRLLKHLRHARASSRSLAVAYLRRGLKKRLDRLWRRQGRVADITPNGDDIARSPAQAAVRAGSLMAMARYLPSAYDGKIIFLLPSGDRELWCEPEKIWSKCTTTLEVHTVHGDHWSIMRDEVHAAGVAAVLSHCLETLDGEESRSRT